MKSNPKIIDSLDKIPVGYNLRGMTIEFTNTDKRVPPVVPPEDDPDFTGYGLLTGSVEEPTWGIGYLNFGGTLIAATGEDGDFDPIFLDNIAEGGEYDQVWLKTVVTVPDDKDYIVVQNNLPAHKGDDWGFDHTTITNTPPPPLTLDKVPIGFNFRGKTVVFTNTDRPMTDRGMFDREDWIGGPISGSRWALSSTFDGGGGGEDEIYIGAGSGQFSVSLWFVGVGWQQTSFTFPDNEDYIVDTNTLRPAVGDSWGWSYAIIT